MLHNFKYTFITLFKNKALIFWTFAFPILLGTFFQMAFQDIENSEKLHKMKIAIVENERYQNSPLWKEIFASLSNENNPNPLFDIFFVKEENEATELLKKDEVVGYLKLEETPKIVVQKSGIYQTIFKSVVEEIQEQEILYNAWVQKNLEDHFSGNSQTPIDATWYQNLYQEMIEQLNTETKVQDITRSHLSYTMIEFYTLIAMAALYGGILGMTAINQVLANMSEKGKRMAMSPISKGKLVFSSVMASYFVQLIGITLLFFYTIFVLKVDYGNHLFQVVLLALVGSFAGLSLGVATASILKVSENTKIGVILAITMLGCFLSGMMGITMKYIIDKNIPMINKINPASMITDGFYALYYYDTFERFYNNIISLLLFSFLMLALSIIYLRRQKYDSI